MQGHCESGKAVRDRPKPEDRPGKSSTSSRYGTRTTAEGAALGLSIREICSWTEGDRFSGDPMKRTSIVFATIVALSGATSKANVTASSVVKYNAGTAVTWTDPTTALGRLSADPGDGANLNPF